MFKGSILCMLMVVCLPAFVFGSSCSKKTQEGQPGQAIANKELKTAVFAGGCFWCVESDFEKLPGVYEAVSGYTGGPKETATYKQSNTGKSGHVEAVEVYYHPEETSYEKLVEAFWRMIDPTDDGGQFVDRGSQYRAKVFYENEQEKTLAEKSKEELQASGRFSKPIVTPILPAKPFYRAEDYHQNYYKENPVRYKYYRYNSGRDKFIEKHWSKKVSQVMAPYNP